MRTKWQILTARRDKAAEAYNRICREMEGIEASDPASTQCGTCHEQFFTQGDYDRHYLIDDEQYLNLGSCPTRYNNGRLMPAFYGWGKSLEEIAYEEDAKR